MKLTIVTPTSTQTADIMWLEVNSSAGNFVFQEGQAPLMLVLAAHQPIIYSSPEGNKTSLDIPSGILHIQRHEAIILVTQAAAVQ